MSALPSKNQQTSGYTLPTAANMHRLRNARVEIQLFWFEAEYYKQPSLTQELSGLTDASPRPNCIFYYLLLHN